MRKSRLTRSATFPLSPIDAFGPRGKVGVYLARKAHNEVGPPRSGVLVTVSGSADDVRDIVARAVERRTGRKKRYSGEAETAADVRKAVTAAAPHEPPGKTLASASTAVAGTAAGAAGTAQDRVLPLLAVAVGVGVIWVIAVLLLPRVEVQAVTRAKRGAELAYKGVGAALVTAVIGVVVSLVFGGK